MSAFQDAISGGLAAIRQAAGVSIVYRRAGASVPLTAVPANSQFEEQTTEGVIARTKTRDYLIAVADLELEGEPIQPEPGDKVAETINGVDCEFEVVPMNQQAGSIYSDRAQTQYRIHTVQVS